MIITEHCIIKTCGYKITPCCNENSHQTLPSAYVLVM